MPNRRTAIPRDRSDKLRSVIYRLIAELKLSVVSVNWWKSSWHQPSTSEQLII